MQGKIRIRTKANQKNLKTKYHLREIKVKESHRIKNNVWRVALSAWTKLGLSGYSAYGRKYSNSFKEEISLLAERILSFWKGLKLNHLASNPWYSKGTQFKPQSGSRRINAGVVLLVFFQNLPHSWFCNRATLSRYMVWEFTDSFIKTYIFLIIHTPRLNHFQVRQIQT